MAHSSVITLTGTAAAGTLTQLQWIKVEVALQDLERRKDSVRP